MILKEYDEKLKPSEIRFDRMDIWVRILNLPLGWMNQQRGSRAMHLLGEVKQMDVDSDGKAGGAFLRARVAIELDRPLKRGVLLRMTRDSEPEWFDAQYEKLPFFCFSCGLIGHRGLGCDKPVVRNAQGKLPYDRDIPLRAPDDRRKKIQSFMEAAAESYGSGSSSNNRSARSTSRKQGRHGAESREEAQHEPRKATDGREKNDEEVLSPLKRRAPESQGKETETSGAGKQLFQDVKNAERK